METVIRVAVVYLFLMVALRIMGKRELGDLSPFELVTLLLIPELLQQALVRDDFSLTNAIVAVSTLFSLVFATSVLSHRFPRFGRMTEGQPAVLVHDGKLVPRALNRERVAPDELFSEMHKAGLDNLARVRWAILNTDGRIAFVPVDDPHPRPAPAESRPGTTG